MDLLSTNPRSNIGPTATDVIDDIGTIVDQKYPEGELLVSLTVQHYLQQGTLADLIPVFLKEKLRFTERPDWLLLEINGVVIRIPTHSGGAITCRV